MTRRTQALEAENRVLAEVLPRAIEVNEPNTHGHAERVVSYADALARYGTDKPDTRVQLELVDLTDAFRSSAFRAFRSIVDSGGIVKCLPIHDAGDLSRSAVDRTERFVKKELGAKGLAWIRVMEDGSWPSPIVKFPSENERESILQATGARPGTLIFFQADAAPRANAVLARLREDFGRQLGRIDDREWDVLFVVDFPLFEPFDPIASGE